MPCPGPGRRAVTLNLLRLPLEASWRQAEVKSLAS